MTGSSIAAAFAGSGSRPTLGWWGASGPAPGFIGPVGAGVAVVADESLSHGVYVAGANEEGKHLLGVEPGRDFDATFADIRLVEEGDRCPMGGTIRIEPAIEVGN